MSAVSSDPKMRDAYNVTEKTLSKDPFPCFPQHLSHSFLLNPHLFMLQHPAPVPPPRRHVPGISGGVKHFHFCSLLNLNKKQKTGSPQEQASLGFVGAACTGYGLWLS